MYLSVPKKAMM